MQALIAIIVALAVTVAVLWFFFAPRKAFRARFDNGVQEAVVEVKGGYSPAVIEAEAGLPLRLIFDRKEDGECSSHVVFSDFGVDLALPPFRTTTLTIHPDRPGEYGFACGMNMLHGTLRVLPGKHHAAMQDEYSASEENPNNAESHVPMQSQQTAVDETSYESVDTSSDFSSVSAGSSDDSSASREMRALVTRLIVSAIVTIPVFASTMLMLYPMPNWAQFILMLPVMCYAALPIFRSGFAAIIHRSPEMNALVSLGTVFAFAYSCVVTFVPQILPENAREPYFEAVGVVITLMLVGQLLEARARVGTGEAMRALAGLQPKNARVVRGEIEEEIPVDQVLVGDIIAIRPGEQLPVDGTVISGSSSIDESMITGESMPVRKITGATVYAGTVVEEGECVLTTRAEGGANRYDKIVAMIEESEKLKSSTENRALVLADKLVPWCLGATVVTYLLTRNATRAISCLMVDFSCALKLSMPLAVLSAMRECGSYHITVKGGKYLEALSKADTIVFDKTGTLTRATPQVVEVPFSGCNEREVLQLAACLEEHFPHSMANAVVRAAKERGISHEEMHSEVEYIVAHGIASRVGGQRVVIGSHHFVFEDEKCTIPTAEQQKFDALKPAYSHLYMAASGQLVGVICISDPLRPEAAAVLNGLRALGIRNTVMMTGDSERTAAAIAKQVGVDRFFAEVLPEDKANFVQQAKAEGHTVVMIGDGINDSPALSAADIGIAINSGAAIAREIADVTIKADSLEELVALKAIANSLQKRVHANYRFVLTFNSALIALGALGILQPASSAMLHNLSTIGISLKSMTNLLPENKAPQLKA